MLACCFGTSMAAIESVSTTNSSTVVTATKESKLQSKLIEKFQKKIAKYSERNVFKAFDADSLLDKDAKWWLRTWLICWAVGLLFSILGSLSVYGLWYIGYLFWTLGSIAAVIWLLKIFEAL